MITVLHEAAFRVPVTAMANQQDVYLSSNISLRGRLESELNYRCIQGGSQEPNFELITKEESIKGT